MSKLLELKNINFSYLKNSFNTNHNPTSFFLNNISFSVNEGNFVSVIGKNGSGKSTLVKLISKILVNYSGNIFYKGIDIHSIDRKEYSRMISYLPQSNIFFNEDLAVSEFLPLGRYSYKRFTDFNFSQEDKWVVSECMEETGTKYLSDKYLYELSGGERQKILLTLGLVQLDITKGLKEKILIIDEPLTYLDISYQYEIFNILKKLNERQLTIIIVIHDLNFALKYTDKSILMNKGKLILHSDSPDVITEEIIKEHFLINSKILNWENNISINYFS